MPQAPFFGVITGVASEEGALKVGCRIGVIDRSTFVMVDTTVTDSYGVYVFEFLNPAKQYTVVALDDDTPFKNAVIVDFVTPVEGYRDWGGFFRLIAAKLADYAGTLYQFDDGDTANFVKCLAYRQSTEASPRQYYAYSGYQNDDWPMSMDYIQLRPEHPPKVTDVCPPSPLGARSPAGGGLQRQMLAAPSYWLSGAQTSTMIISGHLPTGEKIHISGQQPEYTAVARPMIVIESTGISVNLSSGGGSVVGATASVPIAGKFWVMVVVTAGVAAFVYVNGVQVATFSVAGSVAWADNRAVSLVWNRPRDTNARIKFAAAIYGHAASAAFATALQDTVATKPPVVSRNFQRSLLALNPSFYAPLTYGDTTDLVSGKTGAAIAGGTITSGAGFTADTPNASVFAGKVVTWSHYERMSFVGFTWAAWVRRTGTITARILSHASLAAANLVEFGWWDSGYPTALRGKRSDGSVFTALNAIPLNTDVFLTVREGRFIDTDSSNLPQQDVPMNRVIVSVNGVNVASTGYNENPVSSWIGSRYALGNALHVGGTQTGVNSVDYPFTGAIGHVALWQHALSDEQVAWLYASRNL